MIHVSKFARRCITFFKKKNLHFDFHENDDNEICIKKYDTNIMNRFICRNFACDFNE